MEKYDVIIIWSGLWWLSAWALLSKKWKKVLVLEKHYLIWWYATNFKRKGFEFDVALHQIWWVEKTWFSQILKKAWVYEKLNFIKHKYLYEAIYPDFELKVENWNINKLKSDLISLFPKEKFWVKLWLSIMKYVWFQLKIWDFTQRNKVFLPVIMIFSPLLIPVLAFWSKLKISTVLNICTKNKKLQKVFMELLWYYWDDLSLSAIYYLIPSYWYYFDWGYFIYGWWQAVSNAFVEVIKLNWWEVKHSTEVEEVLLDWNKAIWVKTKKWDFYAENIISNASPFILYEKLLKNWDWSKKELEKLQSFEVWPTIWAMYIWLDTTIKNLNPRYKDSYIISINESYDIAFEKNNAIWFTITNHNDNNWIPEWKTVLTIALYMQYKDWDKLTQEKYKAKKQEEIEKVLIRLEKYFPNIKNHIEVIEFWTPKTMERYTWNTNWAIYWFSQKVSNKPYGNTTPIKNIYLSSAWSFGWWFEWVIRAWNEVVKKIKNI